MYIKHLELSYFKSFGGTTQIPLLPGFTVVSGPNGSGKSNILDALLFALGLSGSKGMRAERLPDLVNHTQSTRRSIVEASVTVTFDLADYLDDYQDIDAAMTPVAGSGDSPEWQVTRKLRVTQQGTYTSNYAINGQPCTLHELHEQLSRLRIYPEGYNVVLQGDVTGIISMNSRQRREIIDELAGVADFDRKIAQATEKLDQVKEREDRFRIVENELKRERDRLERDRVQAEKYQQLRAELQAKTQWEAVLLWRSTEVAIQQLVQQLQTSDQTAAELAAQLNHLQAEIAQITTELEQLNAQVKALGEDQHLALQSALATRSAELRQLARQQQELEHSRQATGEQIGRTQQDLQIQKQGLAELAHQQVLQPQIVALHQQRDQTQQLLDQSRAQASVIAATAEAWVQQQASLHQQVDVLLQTLEPQRAEQSRLSERVQQLERQVQEQTNAQVSLRQEIAEKQAQLDQAEVEVLQQQQQVQSQAQAVAKAEQDWNLQQETQARLLREQRERQRQLDKLEAQLQAAQEAQGTSATRLILGADLPGMHGLVAQLGRVEPLYQLALEIAAGARLSSLVVEDDAVAAAGIELLKQARAGRATFLPLNQMQSPRPLPALLPGAIGYALDLVNFQPRYRQIFAYVFGNTVVFETLAEARRYLGQSRLVTLQGDLLETTGAMTGGSRLASQAMHFGTEAAPESPEVVGLKVRLREIEQVLEHLTQHLAQGQTTLKQQGELLTDLRQQYRETQLQRAQLATELTTLSTRLERLQLQFQQQELAVARERLQVLENSLPQQAVQLLALRGRLAELEQSPTHQEWQQVQTVIRTREAELTEQELALRSAQQKLQDWQNQQQRLQEAIRQAQSHLQESRTQQTRQLNQHDTYQRQGQTLAAAIAELQTGLTQLEQRLGTEKQQRDRRERRLREQLTAQQQLLWQQQKLQATQQTQQSQLKDQQAQLQAQAAELPHPLPQVPDIGLEQLRQELRSQQQQLRAMEPVNMLAIQDYERTQERLEELTAKLTTLAAERTELLLRIENFTTLRHQVFREAFDAVNQNFQTIFAELSDGDGYLQLEDPQDPFRGGLNLVAHPKGKPVQRLASMSGGEKSLTALSFIFALQRYRPSPFYAFDEVDMFLDGANVERLAKMIRQHAQQAQFIVVSLRRPMIESAERTIGVTQARGTHTQVLGLRLQPRSASV